jgi:YD repeat-containing protein
MPINPSIAMSYRAPDIQPQNMLADYAAIQQIQSGKQAQQLNALQLQEYQRARTEEEGVRNYLANRNVALPETRTGLTQFGKTGREYLKTLAEQDTAAATLAETKSKTGEREFDLKKKRLDASIKDFASFNTVSDVLGHIKRQLDSGDIDQATAQQLASQVPQSDAELPKFQIAMLRKTLGAKDQLDLSKQTTKDTDRGGYIERQTYDSQGKPVGAPVKLPKTATIGERTAQQRLQFEKSNQGKDSKKPLTALQQQTNKKDYANDSAKVKAAITTADELEKLTDELIGNPDKEIKPHPGLGGITGYAGLLPSLPKGEAAKAEQKLETFKGKIKALGRSIASQEGKLGNMAVQEWQMVSDAVQSIKPTAGNLDEQMRDVVRQARDLARNVKDKFDLTYEGYAPEPASGGATGEWGGKPSASGSIHDQADAILRGK